MWTTGLHRGSDLGSCHLTSLLLGVTEAGLWPLGTQHSLPGMLGSEGLLALRYTPHGAGHFFFFALGTTAASGHSFSWVDGTAWELVEYPHWQALCGQASRVSPIWWGWGHVLSDMFSQPGWSLAVSIVLQTQEETPGVGVVGSVWWGQGSWPRLSACGQIWVRWVHPPDRPGLAGLHRGWGPALSSAASIKQSTEGNAELEAGLEPVLSRGLNFTLRRGLSGEWSRRSQLPPPPIRLRLRTVAIGLSLCPWRPANLRPQAPCSAPSTYRTATEPVSMDVQGSWRTFQGFVRSKLCS